MKSPLHNAPVNVKPQGRGNYPREIDSASFSLGGDFDIRVLPWGREFDIVTTCLGQKAVPRGARGNLTFSRCPGVGNLTLALVKMSNSPGSDLPSSTLGLNIDRCINYFGHQTVNIWLFDEANMTFGCFCCVFFNSRFPQNSSVFWFELFAWKAVLVFSRLLFPETLQKSRCLC